MQTKTVEFDNGAEVTVNDEGDVEEADVPDQYDQFFSKLQQAGFEVERDGKKWAFVGGRGGEGMIISSDNDADIMEIINCSDVNVKHFWPSYEDESNLQLFISLL